MQLQVVATAAAQAVGRIVYLASALLFVDLACAESASVEKVKSGEDVAQNNLFDSSSVTQGVYINSVSGELSPLANSSVSDFIRVSPGSEYFLSGRKLKGTRAIAFYKSSKFLLPAFGKNYEGLVLNGSVTVPSGASYIRFTTQFNGSGELKPINFVENKGTISFEKYTARQKDQVPKEKTESKAVAKVSLPLEGSIKNLFDENKLSSGYLQSSSGLLAPNARSKISDYIAVVASTPYYISGRDLASTKCIVFYDTSKVLLPPIGASYEDVPLNGALVSPPGAAFVRFTVNFAGKGSTKSVQFEQGGIATAYETYGTLKKRAPKQNLSASALPGSLVIDIRSSEKIAVFGNSYTNGYCMHKKHYLDVLSMYSDYQFRNYGKSGDDLTEILQRVRDDSPWLGTIPVSQWGITYGVIACRDNNAATYDLNIETYYEGAKKLARAIETLGGKPILSTEHQTINNGLFNSLQRLSREEGYLFANWNRRAAKLRGDGYFEPFWHNRHPSTRTHWLWANGLRQTLDSLPEVKQGLKVFRVRPDSSTALTDLIYEDNYERAAIYEELVIGQKGLTAATENRFDRLDQSEGKYSDYNDEYQSLQSGTSVAMGDHFLAEIITPYSSSSLTYFDLSFAATGVSKVYIKKTLGLTRNLSAVGTSKDYQDNFEKPVGEWMALTVSGNKVTVPRGVFKHCVTNGKLVFLFAGTRMSLTDIRAAVAGTTERKLASKPALRFSENPELLKDTHLANGTAWKFISRIPKFKAIVNANNAAEIEEFPVGVKIVRELSGSHKLMQSLPSVTDSWETEIVQIRVVCRNFPQYASNDRKSSSSRIKRGSYDALNLSVSVKNGSDEAIRCALEPVGLYWQEVIVKAQIEPGTSSIIIESPDGTLQIAEVSVKKL